jgi:hypothetical protein
MRQEYYTYRQSRSQCDSASPTGGWACDELMQTRAKARHSTTETPPKIPLCWFITAGPPVRLTMPPCPLRRLAKFESHLVTISDVL